MNVFSLIENLTSEYQRFNSLNFDLKKVEIEAEIILALVKQIERLKRYNEVFDKGKNLNG